MRMIYNMMCECDKKYSGWIEGGDDDELHIEWWDDDEMRTMI